MVALEILIVTQKDLSVIRKNKYVFYSLLAMPRFLVFFFLSTFVFALNAEYTRFPMPNSPRLPTNL